VGMAEVVTEVLDRLTATAPLEVGMIVAQAALTKTVRVGIAVAAAEAMVIGIVTAVTEVIPVAVAAATWNQ